VKALLLKQQIVILQRKTKTYATLSGPGPGPLPNRRALVNFTGSPFPRFVGSGYNLAFDVEVAPNISVYCCLLVRRSERRSVLTTQDEK